MKQNQLGENIAKFRKEKGLSQEKVAEYMGVSRQAVTKWENNISKPSTANLFKLAALLEVSVEVLLGFKDTGNTIEIENISVSKASGIFCGFSVVCIFSYIILSSWADVFRLGTLLCMFFICFPIQ